MIQVLNILGTNDVRNCCDFLSVGGVAAVRTIEERSQTKENYLALNCEIWGFGGDAIGTPVWDMGIIHNIVGWRVSGHP